MSKQRSTGFDTFISLADSELLRKYLQKVKALPEGDNSPITIESIHKILSDMEDRTKAIDIEDDILCFQEIAERGVYDLHAIARHYKIEVKSDEAPQNIALKVFLHQDQNAFDTLYDSYVCKTCYAKLTYYPVKAETVDCGAEAFEAFKQEISETIKEQKPDECLIRHHDYKGGQYILITRQDKAHSYRTLEGKRVRPRLYRPAKEDAIYYDQKRGVIGVSSGFRGSATKKLCVRAFAKAVLKLPTVDEKVFSSENGLMALAPLKTSAFYEPTKQVAKIELICAEYSHKGTADICISSEDVRATVKELAFPETDCEFVSAKVRFSITGQSRTQTVHINKKGFTALKNHAAREIIEAYLREQKVVLF